jgi:hypothetical protein
MSFSWGSVRSTAAALAFARRDTDVPDVCWWEPNATGAAPTARARTAGIAHRTDFRGIENHRSCRFCAGVNRARTTHAILADGMSGGEGAEDVAIR